MYSTMPRSRVNYRIDDRVLEAMERLAGKGKTNQFVEGVLITFLQNTKQLPPDFEPLTEARGGKRSGAGKPKKSQDSITPNANDNAEDNAIN